MARAATNTCFRAPTPQFAQARRKALLVMATGSGKTRTAIALVDLLQRAGWVKRALFLADRVALVNQAVGAFRAHLPQSSPVNLVTERDTTGRVYVCTYPTMMGLIDETTCSEARFEDVEGHPGRLIQALVRGNKCSSRPWPS